MRRNQAVCWAGSYFAPITLYTVAPSIAFATVNPLDFELDTTDERHSIVARDQGWVASGICLVSLNYNDNCLEGYECIFVSSSGLRYIVWDTLRNAWDGKWSWMLWPGTDIGWIICIANCNNGSLVLARSNASKLVIVLYPLR